MRHMEQTQPSQGPALPPLLLFGGVAAAFAWLIFLGLWLFFYAGGYSILQNIGIFFLSLAVLAVVETGMWIPWAMKQPSWGQSR
jgi:hypothetical protein